MIRQRTNSSFSHLKDLFPVAEALVGHSCVTWAATGAIIDFDLPHSVLGVINERQPGSDVPSPGYLNTPGTIHHSTITDYT